MCAVVLRWRLWRVVWRAVHHVSMRVRLLLETLFAGELPVVYFVVRWDFSALPLTVVAAARAAAAVPPLVAAARMAAEVPLLVWVAAARAASGMRVAAMLSAAGMHPFVGVADAMASGGVPPFDGVAAAGVQVRAL